MGLVEKLELWTAKHKNALTTNLTSKICKRGGGGGRAEGETESSGVNDCKS